MRGKTSKNNEKKRLNRARTVAGKINNEAKRRVGLQRKEPKVTNTTSEQDPSKI